MLYIWAWSLSIYMWLKASAVGGKWGEIPGCPCVRKKERAGERESTLEHLQLSCKSHCRALLLRYDFIAAPTGVEIEVITSSLLPEHWAANSLIPAINCICARVCVFVFVCVFLWISVQRTEGFCCSSPTGTVRKTQPTHGLSSCCFFWIIIICVVHEC